MSDDAEMSDDETKPDPGDVAPPAADPSADPTEEAADGDVAEAAPEPAPEPDPLEQAQAEAKRFREQLLRTAADFDNYRKRARREVADAESQAREELLKEILPVFDNLERAAAHAETATDVQALSDGIKMVMRMFFDTLGKLDICKVESVGKPFDPAVHEAIQHMESTEFPPGTVTAEVQPGYRMGERLMRPAMVVVAKAPAAPEAG